MSERKNDIGGLSSSVVVLTGRYAGNSNTKKREERVFSSVYFARKWGISLVLNKTTGQKLLFDNNLQVLELLILYQHRAGIQSSWRHCCLLLNKTKRCERPPPCLLAFVRIHQLLPVDCAKHVSCRHQRELFSLQADNIVPVV